MNYRVIRFFTDLQDNDQPYNVGDIFPREGLGVTQERLAELSGRHNAQGVPLIEAVETETEPEKPKTKRAKKSAQK